MKSFNVWSHLLPPQKLWLGSSDDIRLPKYQSHNYRYGHVMITGSPDYVALLIMQTSDMQ